MQILYRYEENGLLCTCILRAMSELVVGMWKFKTGTNQIIDRKNIYFFFSVFVWIPRLFISLKIRLKSIHLNTRGAYNVNRTRKIQLFFIRFYKVFKVAESNYVLLFLYTVLNVRPKMEYIKNYDYTLDKDFNKTNINAIWTVYTLK